MIYPQKNKSGMKKILKNEWGIFMCKCKKETANMLAPAKASVNVTVNVTNIVKYISLAGVAIVGIIFGTKSYIESVKVQKAGNEK